MEEFLVDFLVEGRKLDPQQMQCITEYHHNHLVVAGAGTGKTTTIVGKIKWLLINGKLRPEEILVLSFTNASAAEMKERILSEIAAAGCIEPNSDLRQVQAGPARKETWSDSAQRAADPGVAAMTFHKLGLTIIRSVYPEMKIAADPDDKRADEVNFNDMILMATDLLREKKYKSPFKFVIVDEYQDISRPRYELLAALREVRDYDLFCVGDDWQAIYGFAGSEIDLILNFEKYWGEYTLAKIETTYRFPESLAYASGKFIMENLAQIPKKIRALPDQDLPHGGKGWKRGKNFAVTEIQADSLLLTIEASKQILQRLPENSTVYYIGRYTRDVGYLKHDNEFKVLGSALKVEESKLPAERLEGAGIPILYKSRPDLSIKFLTAHKSKGLQAEYVFAMNLKSGRLGFPSKVIDEEAVASEKFPFAEERRLFYVTLTRAKKQIFLLAPVDRKSEFVEELEDLLYGKMRIIKVGILDQE